MKKTSATDSFQSASDFVERLRSLRQLRRGHKLELHNQVFNRQSLSGREREDILAKTDSRCHICGGPIEGNTWEADHVVSHSPGGQQSIDTIFPLIRSVAAIGGCTNLRNFSGFSNSVSGLERRLKLRRSWDSGQRGHSVSMTVFGHSVARDTPPNQKRLRN